MRARIALWVVVLAGCAVPSQQSAARDSGHGDSDAAVADLAEEPPADLATSHDLSTPRADSGSTDGGAMDLAGAIPTSWGSPSTAPTDVTLGWNGNYAAGYRLTLAADDPSATIYYTTDGTAPALSSPHGLSPLPSFAIAATTRVRWFAAGAAGMETAHDDSYGVNPALQSSAGYLTQDTSFEGHGPVLIVTPGQVVSATTTFRIWYQSGGCSGGTFPCAAQLVYGVDLVEQDCLFAEGDGGANKFSVSTAQPKAFTVTAPMALGVHEVQVAQIEDFTCAQAKTDHALGRPTRTRIGVLIVR